MYLDLLVLLIIILLVVFFFKRFSSFVYMIVSLDILYKLLHFLKDNLHINELSTLIDKYIPKSVVDMITNYVGEEGIFYQLLIWFMFFMYLICLFYIIRILVKRKY